MLKWDAALEPFASLLSCVEAFIVELHIKHKCAYRGEHTGAHISFAHLFNPSSLCIQSHTHTYSHLHTHTVYVQKFLHKDKDKRANLLWTNPLWKENNVDTMQLLTCPYTCEIQPWTKPRFFTLTLHTPYLGLVIKSHHYVAMAVMRRTHLFSTAGPDHKLSSFTSRTRRFGGDDYVML